MPRCVGRNRNRLAQPFGVSRTSGGIYVGILALTHSAHSILQTMTCHEFSVQSGPPANNQLAQLRKPGLKYGWIVISHGFQRFGLFLQKVLLTRGEVEVQLLIE